MEIISEKRIEQQIIENGFKLLGQIPVNDEDYEKLLSFTKTRISNMVMSALPNPSLMISVALVQIAIRHYKEGKYWRCFLEAIDEDVSASRLNYLGQIFSRTIKKYGLFEMRRDNNSSQMYVENIKAHAFVTNYYMPGFFDFSYAFFENNLFRELSDDLNDDLDALSSFMSKTLQSNGDEFGSDDSGKKAAKTYKLLKSTRAVFSQGRADTIYSNFFPVLSLIDKYYYDDEVPVLPQNRFERLFVEWCRAREVKEHIKKTHGITARHVYSNKPFIHVDVEKEYSFLVIPAQKFRNEDCSGKVSVDVTINGNTVRKELDLYRSFGIYISEELVIPIPDIFDRIELIITSNCEKKYIFPSSNYRIFNQDWESKEKFSKGHNYLLVKSGIDVLWSNDHDLIDQTNTYIHWNYYSANISEDSVCYIGNKPISIIGEFSKEPIFEKEIESFSVFDEHGKKILPVRSHPSFSFVVDKQKLNGTILSVNQKRYAIRNIQEKSVYEWPEDKNKYAISLVLEDILPYVDNVYRIYIDVPGETNKKICEYVLLRDFRYSLDKANYVYADEGYIHIQKSGHELISPNVNWKLDFENKDIASYVFPITDDLDSIGFSIKLDDHLFNISIVVRKFMYGFSLTSMTSKKTDYLWYTDLGETLYVQIPNGMDVFANWGRDTSRKYFGEEIGNSIFRIDISEIKRKIKTEYKIRAQYINIGYIDNKPRHIALPVIFRNVVVDPFFKLNVEEGSLYTDIGIKGDAELFLSVKHHNTDEYIVTDMPLKSGKNFIPELEETGFYDFFPYMEEPDEFGFESEKTELKRLIGVGYVDINNLVNCRLVIENVLTDEENLLLDYRYYVQIYEKIEEDLYTGSFYRVQTENKKAIWSTAKPFGRVRITVYQKDEEIKFSLAMYSKNEEEWLTPYYDKLRHFILGCDNKILETTTDYNRFIPLEEDYTEYIVDMNKLRRIR